MSPRNLIAVVVGVLGVVFAYRTVAGPMWLMHEWTQPEEDVPGFILGGPWRQLLQVGFVLLPFLCSLVVLANRWGLAQWFAAGSWSGGRALSRRALECAGLVGLGMAIAFDGLNDAASILSQDRFWWEKIEYGGYAFPYGSCTQLAVGGLLLVLARRRGRAGPAQ